MKEGGLAGVVAGASSICLCSAEDESLLYRGYAIEDLAKEATFEEVAYLLTRGSLPQEAELSAYKQQLKSHRIPPEPLLALLKKIPRTTHPMAMLRTACSYLGNLVPETSFSMQQEMADLFIAQFGPIVAYFYRGGIVLETTQEGLAGHFLQLLSGKVPTKEEVHALDVSLILYAEHEFNASTFTVRTIASTLADFPSAICGGIGALSGKLHGGANEKALELITSFSSPESATKGVLKMLSEKKLIMGFGHRVYTKSDPRSKIIKEYARTLTKGGRLFQIAEAIEKVMWEEKQLFPNLDFYSSLVYEALLIPMELFTPIFVLARIAGWSAHLMEQREHNKLIRPISDYKGPEPKAWIPLSNR